MSCVARKLASVEEVCVRNDRTDLVDLKEKDSYNDHTDSTTEEQK